MPSLETVSKRLALVSLLIITAAQLALHPDATWMLRGAGLVAFVLGWIGGRRGSRMHLGWLLAAALAPALLRLATGREGPVLDMFWMAGLSATLLRRVSWSSWTLPALWRPLAGGWALTVSLAWPILVAREAGFDWSLLQDQGAINSAGLLSAAQATSWILYVAWMHLLGLVWIDWTSAGFVARESMSDVGHALWIGVTAAGVVALYQGTVDLGFLSTGFWAAEARATGTMLDANAYGMCAAIAGPIAFALLRERGATRTGGAVLLLNVAGVWMSGSRVVAFCAVIAIVAVVIGVWQTLTSLGRRHFAISAVVGTVLLAAIIVGADAIGPVRRFAELPDSPLAALAAALNRGEYGETGLAIIRDYPLTGVGIGSYQIFAPDYYRRSADALLAFDSAQNWWRHEAAELGVFGGLPLFVWSGIIAWTVLTARAAPDRTTTATIVRGALIALGVGSVVQMATHAPLVLLWFLFLVAWFAVDLRAPRPERTMTPRVATTVWVFAAVLAVGYAAAHVVLATGPLDAAARARDMRRPYLAGTYPEEQMADGTRFRWTRKEARLLLPGTRWLVLRLWAAHPDIDERPVDVMLTPPCGAPFTIQLKSPEPVSVGIVLPSGSDVFDATLRVSRTWSPADQGSGDRRVIGAGLSTEFVDDPEDVREQTRTVEWPDCR